MRSVKIENKTSIELNTSWEGEPLMITLQRVTEMKEPIEMTSPIIYTERDDGVLPEYDIRTDRFELAREAMDKISASKIAKRAGNSMEDAAGKPAGEPAQATED